MPIGPETYAWRRRLPHLQRLGRHYFITFVTEDRHVLQPSARTIVLETIVAGHERSYSLYVATVMPDHVHLILTPVISSDSVLQGDFLRFVAYGILLVGVWRVRDRLGNAV